MASFVVMEPPRGTPTDRTRFVRDGFSFLALLFPFLWLLWHRLWIEAALVFGFMMLAGTLAETQAWAEPLAPLTLLAGLYVALEGPALRMAGLARRGWHEAGVVEAADSDEAELRWFGRNAGRTEVSTTAVAATHDGTKVPSGTSATAASAPLGLFGYTGR